MKRHSSSLFAVFVCAQALAASSGPFDWPQWQGPNRDAISQETGLLTEWPKDGPPLAWKATGLGGGDGAPAVAAGRIYGMGTRDGNEVVWALSEADGKELWIRALAPLFPQGMPQSKEGPGCTPTVDGDRLYALTMGGTLACLQVADGKVRWQLNLVTDFGGVVPTWSYRESPLVDGNKLICTPGGPEALLVALDKLTGKTLWKSSLPGAAPAGTAAPAAPPGAPAGGAAGVGDQSGPGRRGPRGGPGGFGGPRSGAAYSSVIAIDFEGQRQYVQLTADALIGVAADDGRFLWRYDRPANRMGINCSTPLHHEGTVFAASAYGAGGGLVKLTKNADGGIEAKEVWFSRNMENHHGGVVLVDGALYGSNGGNAGGYLACLDFQTGDVLWNERDPDKRRVSKGSVSVADGRLYYRTESGTMLLIEPNRKEYVERGRFEQPDRSRSPAWAHPVIANGKLYLRDQDLLLCYDVKAR